MPKRAHAKKTVAPRKTAFFLLQCEAYRNATVALSPKDSEFLCTFKLTNRIFLDSSVGRAPDC